MDPRLDQVPGFGKCGACLYNTSGPAELCYACAQRTMAPLSDSRCAVCDRPFNAGETACGNPLCNRTDRAFGCNYAVAMRSGELQRAINKYKYEGRHGWALVFGRVLIGFLEQEADLFRSFDVITASPTYVGQGGRTFDHTRTVLEKAAEEAWPGESWPLDLVGPPLIVKTAPTLPMVGHTYRERRVIAEGPLRGALQVTRPQDVEGHRVLVYDDVFTDGLTLTKWPEPSVPPAPPRCAASPSADSHTEGRSGGGRQAEFATAMRVAPVRTSRPRRIGVSVPRRSSGGQNARPGSGRKRRPKAGRASRSQRSPGLPRRLSGRPCRRIGHATLGRNARCDQRCMRSGCATGLEHGLFRP